MFTKCLTIVTALALSTSLTLQAAEKPEVQPHAIPGTYEGTYTWLDMDPGTVGDSSGSLILVEDGDHFKATFSVTFAANFSPDYKDAKTYTYTGTLSKTDKDINNMGKFRFLSGVIAADKGKQSWNLQMKITPKGRAFGIATETDPGYGSWGTFSMQIPGK